MKDGILHGLLCDGQAAVEIISARDTDVYKRQEEWCLSKPPVFRLLYIAVQAE